jgi:hypothetical protein
MSPKESCRVSLSHLKVSMRVFPRAFRKVPHGRRVLISHLELGVVKVFRGTFIDSRLLLD